MEIEKHPTLALSLFHVVVLRKCSPERKGTSEFAFTFTHALKYHQYPYNIRCQQYIVVIIIIIIKKAVPTSSHTKEASCVFYIFSHFLFRVLSCGGDKSHAQLQKSRGYLTSFSVLLCLSQCCINNGCSMSKVVYAT